MKTERDEFSCPCCGTPTDSSYCAACDTAECGERDYRDPSINECLVERAKTAAKVANARRLLAEAIGNVRAWVEGQS